MPGKLTFTVAEVEPIVAHAKAARSHKQAYSTEPGRPSLWLVKDEGCYLMSAGEPPDMLEFKMDGKFHRVLQRKWKLDAPQTA